jgi:uncharacterized membrane protein YhhN
MRDFFVAYSILTGFVIFAQLSSNELLQNLLKPTLMLWLIAGYIYYSWKKLEKFDYLILFALFFSLLGDVFLMPLFDHFIAGLLGFLTAHILYISAFYSEIRGKWKMNTSKIILLILGTTIYAALLGIIYYTLIPKNESPVLLAAIGIYSTALLGLFISTLFRNPQSKLSMQLIMLGGALFLLSDSFLAINRFVYPLPFSPVWVMTTYTAAQALIMRGSLIRNA